MISTLSPLRLLWRGALASALLFFCSAANVSRAQSLDVRSPSPIQSGEVVGSIAARDLGDSRLTDHFYAFTGTPGDVLITVKSRNLNGDVDVFTAGSLRPLMKFTLYAENSSPTTRAVFLRRREDLILRVEARSPNDDEGTYQITLGGSFEPIAGDASVAEGTPSDSAPTVAAVGKGSRRVSSVGARIDEPPEVREEVASAPTPQPTPAESPVPVATPEPTVTAEATKPAPAPAPRRGRGRVPPVRRKPAAEPAKKSEPSDSESKSNSESKSEEKVAEAPSADSPAPAPRRTGKRGTNKPPPEQIPVPEPQTGPRLVIQMLDGTLVERFMSTIKRVTVENNQIVVVKKDGRIERIRMSEVLRMAIEP
ncbi:MAG: hypothetical protein ND895_27700 [Pyrinomonadaceae bacterium]|nr:hypothetical protein [Pyrinomonadaceae bacterium]